MKIDELQELFLPKISLEYTRFKKDQTQLELLKLSSAGKMNGGREAA